MAIVMLCCAANPGCDAAAPPSSRKSRPYATAASSPALSNLGQNGLELGTVKPHAVLVTPIDGNTFEAQGPHGQGASGAGELVLALGRFALLGCGNRTIRKGLAEVVDDIEAQE
jgi:hypothetical protein